MRRIRFVLLSCCVFVFLYLAGVWYFSCHFGFRTFLCGKDVSFCSVERVKSDRIRDVSRRTFSFVRRNGFSEDATFGDLGIFRGCDFYLDWYLPSPWKWPVSFFRSYRIDFSESFDYDPERLREGLLGLDCFGTEHTVQPSCARVSYDDEGNAIFIPGTSGTKLDFDCFYQVVCEAILSGDFVVDLDASGCYISDEIPEETGLFLPLGPVVTRDTYRVDLGYGTSETISSDLVSSIFTEDGLSYDAVSAYVRFLKERYDTVGSVRDVPLCDGSVLSVVPSTADTFHGWDLDEECTRENLCSMFLSGGDSCSVSWRSTGYSHGDSDLGDCYIIISLSDQRLCLMDGGNCVMDIPVVTGLNVSDRRTPSGLFRILDFREDYWMTGYYGSAYVDYFLRLTPDGVGIHDAAWRDCFDPDTYLFDGSHGCINVRPEDMVFLYNYLYASHLDGVAVLIY